MTSKLCPMWKKPCVEEECLAYNEEESQVQYPYTGIGFNIILGEHEKIEVWERKLEKKETQNFRCLVMDNKVVNTCRTTTPINEWREDPFFTQLMPKYKKIHLPEDASVSDILVAIKKEVAE